MADSDKVKHSDIIEPKVFEPTIQDGKELIKVLTQIEAGMRAVLETSKKGLVGTTPRGINEIEKLHEFLKKIDNAERALIETQKQKEALEAKVALQQEKNRQKAAEAAAKEKAATQLLTKNIKDLTIEELKLAKAILQKQVATTKDIKSLIELNKRIQETSKRQRELATVGMKSSNTFGNALSSFQFKFNFLGNLMANFATAGTAKISQFVSGSVNAFIDAEKNANSLAFAVKNVAGESEEAFDLLIRQSAELQKKSIFSDDSIQQQQKALLNFGLTTDQVQKLLPAIIDLASAQGIDLATATDKVIQGINGQTRGLKDAGIVFKDTGSKTQNLGILMDKLGKFTGAAGDSLNTIAGKAAQADNEMDDLQETIGAKLAPALKSIQIALLETTKFVINLFTETGKLDQLLSNISATAEAKEFLAGAAKNLAEFGEVGEKAIMKMANEFNVLSALRDKMSKKDFLAQLKSDFAFLQKQVDEGKLSAIEFGALSLVYQKFLTDLTTNTAKTFNTIKDDSTKGVEELVDKTKKTNADLEKEYRDHLERLRKAKADAEKKTFEDGEQARTKQAEKEIEEREKLLQNYQNVLDKFDDSRKDEDKLKLEEIQLTFNRELQLLIDARKKGIITEEEYQKARLALEATYNDEVKKMNRKRLEDQLKTVEILNDAIFDGLERRNEKQQENIDKQIAMVEDSIEQQQELANRGLDNTLAFEEKRKAESIAKKVELEKKARRQEQAQQLANIFLEFLKSYAKEGAIGAPAKALAQTLIAKGLSDLIAGNFATGIEDFKGKGTETSDSNLIGFSKGESVVTAKGTRENPGLVTAMNEGNVMDYFRENYLPQYHQNLSQDRSRKAQVSDAIYGLLDKRLENLEKTIRHKKEISINWDEHGNMVRQEVEAGIRKHITSKRRTL
jgi:hypothetical protein